MRTLLCLALLAAIFVSANAAHYKYRRAEFWDVIREMAQNKAMGGSPPPPCNCSEPGSPPPPPPGGAPCNCSLPDSSTGDKPSKPDDDEPSKPDDDEPSKPDDDKPSKPDDDNSATKGSDDEIDLREFDWTVKKGPGSPPPCNCSEEGSSGPSGLPPSPPPPGNPPPGGAPCNCSLPDSSTGDEPSKSDDDKPSKSDDDKPSKSDDDKPSKPDDNDRAMKGSDDKIHLREFDRTVKKAGAARSSDADLSGLLGQLAKLLQDGR